MRRALHLLILAAVLCCGLHLGNEAQAREHVAHHLLEAADHHAAGGGSSPDAPGDLAEGGHHHCPVAPAQPAAAMAWSPAPKAMLTAARTTVLHSRSQAPPIEPPLA